MPKKNIRKQQKLEAQNFEQQNFEPQIPLTTQVTPQMGEYDEYSRLNGDGEQVRTYTGMGIFNPALSLEEGNFNLVGMNDGVLQAGISADDGTFLAGAGKVILDADGITLDGTVGVSDTASNVKWVDANGDAFATIGGDINVSADAYTYLETKVVGTVANPYPWARTRAEGIGDNVDAKAIISQFVDNESVRGISGVMGNITLYVSLDGSNYNYISIDPLGTTFENEVSISGNINAANLVQASSDFYTNSTSAQGFFNIDTVASGSVNTKKGENSHLGIVTIKSSATANSGGQMGFLSCEPARYQSGQNLNGEFIIRPLSGNAGHRVLLGFYDSATAFNSMTPTDCNCFTMTGDGTNFTLKYLNRVGGAGTAVTIMTLNVNTWYRLKIIATTDLVKYYVYNSSNVEVGYAELTSTPTTALSFGMKAFRTTTAANDIIDVDRMDFYGGLQMR